MLVGLAIAVASASGAEAKITNACVNSAEKPATGSCHRASFSADSRFMAFDSNASNLVAGDRNANSDVFVRDRKRGKTELISANRKGESANGFSFGGEISADGRFVAFVSVAPDLVRGVEKRSREVYVYDRKTAKTRLVSVAVSGDPAGGQNDEPAISGDGSVIAFQSNGRDLVAGDTRQGSDVFARDLSGGPTVRVSAGPSGAEDRSGATNPSISADGNLVAFDSSVVTTLPEHAYGEVYVKNLETGAVELASRGIDGLPGDDDDADAAISQDGRFVAFSSLSTNLAATPTAGGRDVYVRDRLAQTTTRVSVDATGASLAHPQFKPTISADGSRIAFIAEGRHFDDIVLRDLAASTTTVVTPTTPARGSDCSHALGFVCGSTSTPVLSPDGRLLAFEAAGTGYVPDDRRYVDLLISPAP